MKKLLMMAVVAIFATTACTEKQEAKPTNDPKLSVSIDPTEIAINGKATIKVSSSQAAATDLNVTIAIDKTDVLTAPSSVIIKKGEKSATVEGIGKAEGTANATISCSGATISIASASVKVVKAVEAPIELKSLAPSLTYSTASGAVSALVNLTLTKAVDFDIEIETGYNFDNWDWTNNAEGYPNGVTWSEYPVIFPANSTEHSFSLEIEQGNAGTLPLLLVSLKGSKAKTIKFEPAEYDFVISK